MPPGSKSGRLSPLSWIVLKRQLVVLFVCGGLLGIVVGVLYSQNRKHERGLREQQGLHRVDVAHEFLSREINAVRSDLLYLAEQELLKRFLSGEADVRAELEGEYARFAQRKAVYDQIRCLDTSGKEIVRINFREGKSSIVPASDLQQKEDRYYFGQSLALGRGEVYVSDFDLNVEHGEIERPLRPMIRFATPIYTAAGEKRGLLVLNSLGDHLLRRLNEVALPGSTLVVNSEGEYLLGLSPDDAWGWLLGHDRNFAKQFPGAWERIRQSSQDQIETDNGLFAYRRFALGGRRAADGFSSETAPDSLPSLQSSSHEVSLVLVAYLPTPEVFADSQKLLRQLLLMALGAFLLVAIVSQHWAAGAAVREDQARQIADSEARLRMLSTQLLSAQETERRSISRQLHDGLGQQATAIRLDLKLAARQEDPQRAKPLLSRAIDGTEQLLNNLHEFAARVRPSVLDDLGLQQAAESFISEFEQRTGITVTAKLAIDAEPLGPAISENAYRILQEALTNVAKHAQTSHVSVTMEENSGWLGIAVEDAGIGSAPRQLSAARLGLLGIRERVELLGGEFLLEAAPEKGTRIHVRLPLRIEPDAGSPLKE